MNHFRHLLLLVALLAAAGCGQRPVSSAAPALPLPDNTELKPTAVELDPLRALLRTTARDITATGRVVGEDGSPIVGANIRYVAQSPDIGRPTADGTPENSEFRAESGADGRFEVKGTGVLAIAILSVEKAGFSLFRELQPARWTAPLAEGPAVADHTDEPVVLVGADFSQRTAESERTVHLAPEALPESLAVRPPGSSSNSATGLSLARERGKDGGADSLVLTLDSPEGLEFRALYPRATEGSEKYAARILMDQHGRITGPWRKAPRGGPLFTVHTGNSTLGMIRVTPISMDEAHRLEVVLKAWLSDGLSVAAPPTQEQGRTRPAPTVAVSRKPKAAAGRNPDRHADSVPAAKALQAPPCVLVEVGEGKLILKPTGGLSIEGADGDPAPTKTQMEADCGPGRPFTARITAVSGATAVLTAFPPVESGQPPAFFRFGAEGAPMSVEESDHAAAGWLASVTTAAKSGTEINLPRFPKKFYRLSFAVRPF